MSLALNAFTELVYLKLSLFLIYYRMDYFYSLIYLQLETCQCKTTKTNKRNQHINVKLYISVMNHTGLTQSWNQGTPKPLSHCLGQVDI